MDFWKIIPRAEFIKYLTQFDLAALCSVSKENRGAFQGLLNRMKSWINSKCNILFIYEEYVKIGTGSYYISESKQFTLSDKFSFSAVCGGLDHTFYESMGSSVDDVCNRIIEENDLKLKDGDVIVFESNLLKAPTNVMMYPPCLFYYQKKFLRATEFTTGYRMVPEVFTLERYPPGYWNSIILVLGGSIFIKAKNLKIYFMMKAESNNCNGCRFLFPTSPFTAAAFKYGYEFGDIVCSSIFAKNQIRII